MLRPGLVVPHAAALALLRGDRHGQSAASSPSLASGQPGNGGLALPGGFEASVFHDGVGRAATWR